MTSTQSNLLRAEATAPWLLVSTLLLDFPTFSSGDAGRLFSLVSFGFSRLRLCCSYFLVERTNMPKTPEFCSHHFILPSSFAAKGPTTQNASFAPRTKEKGVYSSQEFSQMNHERLQKKRGVGETRRVPQDFFYNSFLERQSCHSRGTGSRNIFMRCLSALSEGR